MSIDKLNKTLRLYRDDISGNFAMIFALATTMLLVGVGMVTDYSRVTSSHRSAQDALDASAMAAASHYQQLQENEGGGGVSSGPGNKKNIKPGGTDSSKQSAVKHGQSVFVEHCKNNQCGENKSAKFNFGNDNVLTATFDGKIDPVLMNMFGVKELPFSNVSKVNLGEPVTKNLDLVMIIDSTMSMADLGDAVKNNMMDFSDDLSARLSVYGSDVGTVRVKFIFFRDYTIDNYHLWTDRHMDLLPGMERYGPMFESEFFTLPADSARLDDYVDFFATRGGGSDEESSLEAIHHALSASDWSTEDNTARLISLWTDNPPRILHNKAESNLSPSSVSWGSSTWDSWIGNFFTVMSHAEREQYMYDTYYPKEVPANLTEFQSVFEQFHAANKQKNEDIETSLLVNIIESCRGKSPCGDWNTVSTWNGVELLDAANADTQSKIYEEMLTQVTEWVGQTEYQAAELRFVE